tara:strand:+ start:1035 stop:1193 length:159 start_codon:yes stop_codon:yes gene_type:complete
MVKCGYDGCKIHLNGYFNVYHVPTAIAIVTKDGETFYCCEEHYEAGGAFDKL